MNIEVKTIEELFNYAGKYKDIIIRIDEIIEENLGSDDRKLFKEGSFTGIGYMFLPYKNTCYDGLWPLISLTVQKNNISLYVMKFIAGESLVKRYASVFGKSNVGESCIRIKKLDDKRIEAIIEILEICQDSKSIN